MYWQHVHQDKYDGFTINLYFGEEDISPRDCFDYNEEEMQELLRKIDSGLLLWFVAKVTASRAGVVLGFDTLGACCYESVKDFIADDYYEDMKKEAVSHALTNMNLILTPEGE